MYIYREREREITNIYTSIYIYVEGWITYYFVFGKVEYDPVNEWINKLMNQWMNGWMNESRNEWMHESINEWMNQWMNERMHGWMEFIN